MFGLLIATAAGSRTIITSSSDAKLEMAKKMGATHTINYNTNPEWDVEVKRLTNGVGAHHVLDNVGLNEIGRCFGAVAAGGVVTCVGGLGGKSTAVVNIPMLAILKQATLRYVSLFERYTAYLVLIVMSLGASSLAPSSYSKNCCGSPRLTRSDLMSIALSLLIRP